MGINREHRFIFLHVGKTAGKTIESLIWPTEIIQKRHEWAGHYVTCFGDHKSDHRTLVEHTRPIPSRRHGIRLLGGIITELEAVSFHKVIVLRNPFDMLVSRYRMECRRTDDQRFKQARESDSRQFKQFLGWWDVQDEYHQYLVGPDGNLILYNAHVVDFYDLQQSFNDVMERIGAPYRIQGEKVGAAPTKVDYRTYYDDADRQLIQNRYHNDMRLFGFEFDLKGFDRDQWERNRRMLCGS